jgi:predicted MarR family transcription regulator
MAQTSIALIRTMEAFQREALSMFRLVSDADVSFNEVVVLHVVAMHDRPKDAATISRILDRSDVSNLLYNLRKLSSLGLVEKAKDGAATVFGVTEAGRELAHRYAEVRRRVLLDTWKSQPGALEGLIEVTFTLRHMTGVYDAQTRELASLDPEQFPASDTAARAERPTRRRSHR